MFVDGEQTTKITNITNTQMKYVFNFIYICIHIADVSMMLAFNCFGSKFFLEFVSSHDHKLSNTSYTSSIKKIEYG